MTLQLSASEPVQFGKFPRNGFHCLAEPSVVKTSSSVVIATGKKHLTFTVKQSFHFLTKAPTWSAEGKSLRSASTRDLFHCEVSTTTVRRTSPIQRLNFIRSPFNYPPQYKFCVLEFKHAAKKCKCLTKPSDFYLHCNSQKGR